MKTILFPTDFTASTQHALDWALYFARQYKATLVVLHVYQPPIPDATLPTMGDLGVGVMATADLEQIGRENLQKLVQKLQPEGVAIESEWRIGAVEDEIVAVANERDIDLVVTGRSAQTGFFDRLVGSAAADVARAATCPVLVVPNLPDDAPAAPVQVKQVVYATQLEFEERDMLAQTMAVARVFGASLQLVKVDAANQPNLYDDHQLLMELQRQHGDLPLDLEKVKARSVTQGLTEYLESHPADLLVMTTRERTFFQNLINPSETERMVAQTDVPVLVLHG
ncbi:universal stress protein [Rudanella paleaurantiibacter]|uniref:Universal stress protein n=1 Tax=Rudanella paleaurantiibacter TaxID=2614655 RepID=A0A7J5TZT9_9BACT|nr:universal stress protein [Rudanella paleaurantiibacter]KAB7731008.1 universal stress protein [Rudanella paleaurantiibacter]